MSTRWEKAKFSTYLGEDIVEEIRQESIRQDRAISWIMRQAWKLAKPTLMKLPDAPPGSCDRRKLRGRPPKAAPSPPLRHDMNERDEFGRTDELRAFLARRY